MLGRQHLLLSLATALVAIFPVLPLLDGFVSLILLGVAIGSLIPDVDASDATVFHSSVKGIHGRTARIVNLFFAPVFPFFGYMTRYLIYKPALLVFNNVFTNHRFHRGHRNFSHSLIGVVVLSSVTALYISPIVYYMPIIAISHLMSFIVGYVFGSLLHLLQDSCTKSGIAWFAPFSRKKLKGQLRTGKDNLEPRFLLYVLLIQLSVVVFVSVDSGASFYKPLVISLISTSLTWSAFVLMISRAKIK